MNRHDYIYTGRIATGKIVSVSSDKPLRAKELKPFLGAYFDESPVISPTVKEKEKNANI